MEIVFTYEDMAAIIILAFMLTYATILISKIKYREWKIKKQKKKGNDLNG